MNLTYPCETSHLSCAYDDTLTHNIWCFRSGACNYDAVYQLSDSNVFYSQNDIGSIFANVGSWASIINGTAYLVHSNIPYIHKVSSTRPGRF